MKDNNTLLLIVSLALAIAAIVLGVIGKAWAVVCVGLATAIVAAVLLF